MYLLLKICYNIKTFTLSLAVALLDFQPLHPENSHSRRTEAEPRPAPTRAAQRRGCKRSSLTMNLLCWELLHWLWPFSDSACFPQQ